MKLKIPFLLLAVALLDVGPARADDKARPADNKPALHLTIVEPVGAIGNAFTDFDRLDLAFQYVAQQRKWPVKIAAERLAGGSPDYDPEVRITLQSVRLDPGNDYVFRAWTTLILGGKKTDFGIVTYHYAARLGQNQEDRYQEIFRGGAAAIADKIEPLLFPDLKPKN